MPHTPFPPTPFPITGGCACTSLRYTVTIPASPSRPLHPRQSPSAPPTHLPVVFTDHCNDCRRAHGAIVPAWVCVPLEWVTVECARLSVHGEGGGEGGRVSAPIGHEEEERQRVSLSGERALGAVPEGEAQPSEVGGTLLRYYASSPKVVRAFCGRCGTHLSFRSERMEGIVDLVLGTVDRGVLEEGWMRPSRQCWCESAVPWMRGLVGLEGGKGGEEGWAEMGRHPEGEYNDYC